ncbi:MAG: MATE family efflux transporter [Gammaproteobacteria bacterium]|nr:MATE family efflux transporter [Gammaproteobacteria bacterium]
MNVTLPNSPKEWHRKVWSLSWPMILANLTIPLVGVVDTAIMGRLPDPRYVGAIAVGVTIMNALYWMFGFLRMATTGLAAQALGADNLNELAAVALRAAMISLAIGLALILLQVPLNLLAFWLFEASDQVETLASAYFGIRIWGSPAMLLYMVELGVLFGLQQMRATLLISVILNVTNVLLDLLFVIGFGWGVEGVAYGTILSEWLAAGLGLIITVNAFKRSGRALAIPEHLFQRERLAALFHVSSNLIVRTFFVQLPFFMLTALGATLGDLVLAANAVLMQFFFIMAFGLDGFAHAAETLAGHAFGARDPERLRNASKFCALWAGIIACALSLIYAVLGPQLIDLLTLLPEVRETASQYLPWLIALPIISVWAFMFDGIFIGTTRTVELRNSMFVALAIYLIAIWLSFDRFANHGIWLSMSLFMVARSLLLALQYPRIEKLAAVRD